MQYILEQGVCHGTVFNSCHTSFAAEKNPLTEIQEGELYLCMEHRTVRVRERIINLTSKEFDILALLIANPKRVFTYELISRLGRNSIDTGYYIEQYFHAHNVRFIAVTDQFDTADSGNLHGGIMLPLKNMINEAYALDIGRKIKAQARQAMKDGDYIGARAPYGYRKDPDNCHKLLVDENTAPVVKQIFEWAHEHVSLNRIVRNLNEIGIPAPSHYKKGHWRDYQSGPDRKRQMADPYSDENFRKRSLYRRSGARKNKYCRSSAGQGWRR